MRVESTEFAAEVFDVRFTLQIQQQSIICLREIHVSGNFPFCPPASKRPPEHIKLVHAKLTLDHESGYAPLGDTEYDATDAHSGKKMVHGSQAPVEFSQHRYAIEREFIQQTANRRCDLIVRHVS